VLAGTSCEVFCLNLQFGAVRWRNKRKGLAMRIDCFGGADTALQQAALQAQPAAAVAATRPMRNAVVIQRTEERMTR
jgi:hypothetical protein